MSETRTLASLEDEWHTLPPRVVDPERSRRERGAYRVMGDRVVIEVSGLATRGDILPKQRI